jgi:hypothetical protein
MRACFVPVPGLFLAALLAVPALAAPAGWHATMDDGLEAAAGSGRPVLVVTAWKEKV